MTPHLTVEEIRRWKRGALPASYVVRTGQHVAECAECRSAWESTANLDRSVDALRVQLDEEEPHPDVETDLFAYADGSLAADRRAAVTRHLETCGRCREDVADLVATDAQKRRDLNVAVPNVPEPNMPAPNVPEPNVPEPFRRRRSLPRWVAPLAAAAAVIAAVTVVITRGADEPRLPPRVEKPVAAAPAPMKEVIHERPRYERAEWNELLRNVRSGAPLVMPAVLQTLRSGDDVLRGGDPDDAGESLTPTGVVIETARPTFTWPATDGGRYTVSVVDSTNAIVQSDLLTTNRWIAPNALRRGVTYTWQVEVQVEGAEPQVVPRPPSPPARFHIVDQRTLDELATAREHHGDDHLLLGLLYARAGLDARAADELRRIENEADATTAKRLLSDLGSWESD
jgi:hypothetical protein